MRRYIIFISIILLGVTSCKEYLDVNSDSKYGKDYVFGTKEEINRVLTSVYAALMSGNSYGNTYFSTFALNSDVEFVPFSSSIRNVNGTDFRCFDGTQTGSTARTFWDQQYKSIERANIFIDGLQNSPIFDSTDIDMTQQLGEAKVLRAMFYHDLVVMYGDVPFTTEPAINNESFVIPIADRNIILTYLINDLIKAAPRMKYASELPEGIERVSKEFCYGMIARMALTRGGYALYPDINSPSSVGTMKRQDDYKDYYNIAMLYADSVIISGRHSLTKSFRQVFIDECNYVVNNADDPIFEIPFLKNSSSYVGYVTGCAVSSTNDVTTHVWGSVNGSMRLNAFYRYSFDTLDLRQDFTVGMWNYDALGVPQVLADYSTYNNKWCKLWTNSSAALGNASKENTGINFPYMRFADILLMYAEAVNELEEGVSGANGAKAIEALKKVRRRAFDPLYYSEKVDNYVNTAAASKETFFDAITLERKWEFGGENMRWKDLVRWNLYSKVVYNSFMEYYIVGAMANGDYMEGSDKYVNLPSTMFYKRIPNPNDINKYPNTSFQIIEFKNPWKSILNPGTSWLTANFYAWGDENTNFPRAQCLYSFRGYIYGGGVSVDGKGVLWESLSPNNLPPVRYILPIPNYAIQMSNGLYKNYYGY